MRQQHKRYGDTFAHEIVRLKRREQEARDDDDDDVDEDHTSTTISESAVYCAACGLDCSVIPPEEIVVCQPKTGTTESWTYCSSECRDWGLRNGHGDEQGEVAHKPIPRRLQFLDYQSTKSLMSRRDWAPRGPQVVRLPRWRGERKLLEDEKDVEDCSGSERSSKKKQINSDEDELERLKHTFKLYQAVTSKALEEKEAQIARLGEQMNQHKQKMHELEEEQAQGAAGHEKEKKALTAALEEMGAEVEAALLAEINLLKTKLRNGRQSQAIDGDDDDDEQKSQASTKITTDESNSLLVETESEGDYDDWIEETVVDTINDDQSICTDDRYDVLEEEEGTVDEETILIFIEDEDNFREDQEVRDKREGSRDPPGILLSDPPGVPLDPKSVRIMSALTLDCGDFVESQLVLQPLEDKSHDPVLARCDEESEHNDSGCTQRVDRKKWQEDQQKARRGRSKVSGKEGEEAKQSTRSQPRLVRFWKKKSLKRKESQNDER